MIHFVVRMSFIFVCGLSTGTGPVAESEWDQELKKPAQYMQIFCTMWGTGEGLLG